MKEALMKTVVMNEDVRESIKFALKVVVLFSLGMTVTVMGMYALIAFFS